MWWLVIGWVVLWAYLFQTCLQCCGLNKILSRKKSIEMKKNPLSYAKKVYDKKIMKRKMEELINHTHIRQEIINHSLDFHGRMSVYAGNSMANIFGNFWHFNLDRQQELFREGVRGYHSFLSGRGLPTDIIFEIMEYLQPVPLAKSLLHLAAELNEYSAVEELISKVKNESMDQPQEVQRWILHQYVNTSCVASRDVCFSPLNYAVSPKIAQLLINNGAQLVMGHIRRVASRTLECDVLRFLLQEYRKSHDEEFHVDDVKQINHIFVDKCSMQSSLTGNTLLHIVFSDLSRVFTKRRNDVVKYLIEEENADVNKPNAKGATPLHLAVNCYLRNCDTDGIQAIALMLQAGANHQLMDCDGT